MDFLLFSHPIRICNFYHFRRCLFNSFHSTLVQREKKKSAFQSHFSFNLFVFSTAVPSIFPNLKCDDHTLSSSDFIIEPTCLSPSSPCVQISSRFFRLPKLSHKSEIYPKSEFWLKKIAHFSIERKKTKFPLRFVYFCFNV